MAKGLVLLVALSTSAGALFVGTVWLGLRPADLGPAARRALECVGLTLGFFAMNLAVGMAVVFAARQVADTFVSMYFASDITLLGISLLQGVLFQWWRQGPQVR